MITLLPNKNVSITASLLDKNTLMKQRVHALMIMKALENVDSPHRDLPIVNMWLGYEWALLMYSKTICDEWSKNRNRNDPILKQITKLYVKIIKIRSVRVDQIPYWLRDDDLNNSHKAFLLRKDYHFYKKYHWSVPKDKPLKHVIMNRKLVMI